VVDARGRSPDGGAILARFEFLHGGKLLGKFQDTEVERVHTAAQAPPACAYLVQTLLTSTCHQSCCQ